MMASNSDVGAENMIPGGEPNPNRMAQQVQHMFKLRNFYHQMNFSLEQRLAITKPLLS